MPEVDLGLPESRGLRGDAERARHRQLAPAAEREAVDRRDHRLPQVLDGIEDLLPGIACSRPPTGVWTESSLMSAPAMNAFSPAPVRMTARTVSLSFSASIVRAELLQGQGVERVEDLRPVERDDRDAAIDVEEQVFESVGHKGSGYISQPRITADARNPANIMPPEPELGARLVPHQHGEDQRYEEREQRQGAGRDRSLAAHRDVEGVEHDQ